MFTQTNSFSRFKPNTCFIFLCTLTQGDSGDATDDEMGSRKTRSCKEGVFRNGPESDSLDQDEPGNRRKITADTFIQQELDFYLLLDLFAFIEDGFPGPFSLSSNKIPGLAACSSSSSSSSSMAGSNQSRPQSSPTLSGAAKAQSGYTIALYEN